MPAEPATPLCTPPWPRQPPEKSQSNLEVEGVNFGPGELVRKSGGQTGLQLSPKPAVSLWQRAGRTIESAWTKAHAGQCLGGLPGSASGMPAAH